MWKEKMDSHYTTQEHPDSDFYALKFTKESPYENVMVIYGTVKILEDQQLDMATLQFTYNIVDPGDYDHDDLREDKDFNNYLGDLLKHIINEGTIGKSTTDSRTESST